MFQQRQCSSTSPPRPPFLTSLNTAVVELRLGPGTCSLGTQEGQAQLRLGWPPLLSRPSHQGKQKAWQGAQGVTATPEAPCSAAPFPPLYKFSESPLHRK